MTEDFGIRNEDPLVQQIKWLYRVQQQEPRQIDEVMMFLAVARNVAKKLDERLKAESI